MRSPPGLEISDSTLPGLDIESTIAIQEFKGKFCTMVFRSNGEDTTLPENSKRIPRGGAYWMEDIMAYLSPVSEQSGSFVIKTKEFLFMTSLAVHDLIVTNNFRRNMITLTDRKHTANGLTICNRLWASAFQTVAL